MWMPPKSIFGPSPAISPRFSIPERLVRQISMPKPGRWPGNCRPRVPYAIGKPDKDAAETRLIDYHKARILELRGDIPGALQAWESAIKGLPPELANLLRREAAQFKLRHSMVKQAIADLESLTGPVGADEQLKVSSRVYLGIAYWMDGRNNDALQQLNLRQCLPAGQGQVRFQPSEARHSSRCIFTRRFQRRQAHSRRGKGHNETCPAAAGELPQFAWPNRRPTFLWRPIPLCPRTFKLS